VHAIKSLADFIGNRTLTATPTPLPNGMVATDYSQQLIASRGSTPYKWSLVNPPE
jgi:hypothetical protein